jgi:hypothetical protein
VIARPATRPPLPALAAQVQIHVGGTAISMIRDPSEGLGPFDARASQLVDEYVEHGAEA